MTNNEHSIYTAEDIGKYLSGKLSPAQMHAMEKAALDDPFLAEAMEGFEGMQDMEWQDQLAAAKKSLQDKEQEAKVVPLYVGSKNKWWKAAAAVLVMGGLAALTYNLVNKKTTENPGENIAKADQQPPSDTVTSIAKAKTSDSPSVATSTTTDIASNTPQANTIQQEKQQVSTAPVTAPVTVRNDSSFVYRPASPVQNAPAKKDVVSNDEDRNYAVEKSVPSQVATNAATNNSISNNAEEIAANRQVTTMAKRKADAAKPAAAPQFNKAFSAQVLGADNTPLPFANITIKSDNFGTYADVKGNFRLVSTDSLVQVEVRSVGFLPKTYTLNSSVAQNRIVLAEDVSTFGQTVIRDRGTGKASRRATLLKDSIVNVEPADGWENYNTYVSNNIEIPEELLKRNLHGEMEISFSIQPNGTISNIKIDKNGCDNCDEAAARKLIEQGPQWKVKKGKTGRAKIKVQF